MKQRNIILIHFFFWFYIINQSLFPLYIGKLDTTYLADNSYFKDVFISVFLNMISFYTIYFVFPGILKFRRKYSMILASLVIIALITIFRLPLEFYFWKYFGSQPGNEMVFKPVLIWNNLRLVIVIGIYAILIRFMISWFEAQKLRDELINQQQAGELALIRSQVNPHFLFNTLNNIYSLVYRKSDEAPAALMKLSSIMRYMLYDSASEKVPLEKEIEYLKSFIELQNLRIKLPNFVSLHIEGNTDNRFIAPMLLISFVENAFKHGCKTQCPGIIIHLTVEKEQVCLEVINYLKKSSQEQKVPVSGPGLANIKRRLELIYPGKHNLQITEKADTFRINLEIKD